MSSDSARRAAENNTAFRAMKEIDEHLQSIGISLKQPSYMAEIIDRHMQPERDIAKEAFSLLAERVGECLCTDRWHSNVDCGSCYVCRYNKALAAWRKLEKKQ